MDTKTFGKHKFADDSEMTFEEVSDLAFGSFLIPFIQGLADELEDRSFIETLKRAATRAGSRRGVDHAKALGSNDFEAFTGVMRDPDRFLTHVITYDVVEDTDETFEIKVTECLWAKTFRANDAQDIGHAAICHPDFAEALAFNPKMRMTRTKTLMQGHDCCNHHWTWEE